MGLQGGCPSYLSVTHGWLEGGRKGLLGMQLGGKLFFFFQLITKNLLGGDGVSFRDLRGNNTAVLFALWLGLHQLNAEFLLVEVLERELMLKILTHTREIQTCY